MRVVGNIYWYPEVGFDCNTYLIVDEMVTLVDPGTNLNKLLKNMDKDGFNIKDINLIVNTHSHPDHCSLNKKLKEISKAKIAMHPDEAKHMMISQEMARYFGLDPLNFKVDFYVEEELNTGKTMWKIIHTPGHSPGSICLYSGELKVLICGDLVFEGSVGRTDFPGGNPAQLKNSIELVSKLDIEYLLPGHMNPITGKENVKENFEFIKKTFFNLL
mgnify:FL=1